jgi:hypothetical protein
MTTLALPATVETAKVAAALVLDEHALRYQVELTPDEAIDFAANLRDYNEATASRLTALVQRINDLIPPMDFGLLNGEPNPNNGRPHHTFRMGREYSRVLYVCIVKSYLPRDYDWAELVSTLDFYARHAAADEHGLSQTSPTSITFRVWWD